MDTQFYNQSQICQIRFISYDELKISACLGGMKMLHHKTSPLSGVWHRGYGDPGYWPWPDLAYESSPK